MIAASIKPNNIKHLKPLFIFSKCFGVISPSSKPPGILWKIYSVILALAVFGTYFEMLILKITYSPEMSRNLFFVLMDTLCELFLVMSDVTTIVDTTFLNGGLTATFMNLVQREDSYFPIIDDNYCKRRQRIFLVEFLCVVLSVVLYHAYHLYAFVFRVPNVFFRYIFFREISLYLTAINLLQMYYFVLIIRDKYMFLNTSLRKGVATAQRDMFNIMSRSADVYLRKYVEYCDLVDVFNKLFGSRIFWIIGYVVIDTVEGFQIGLNCFAHVRLHRLGDDSCEYVGGATLTELSIHTVRLTTNNQMKLHFLLLLSRFYQSCS